MHENALIVVTTLIYLTANWAQGMETLRPFLIALTQCCYYTDAEVKEAPDVFLIQGMRDTH